MQRLRHRKSGFTLIELVIVLAIAALILVGVLLAVQGAQRSRRDTQRKNDAATIGSYLEQAASTHGGVYPSLSGGLSVARFRTDYSNKLTDPDGTNYTVQFTGTYGVCPTSLGQDKVQVSYNGNEWQVAMYQESRDPFCTNS